MFYVSAMPLFLSGAVFPAFVVFCSLNGPEWLFDIAPSAFKSLLLLFSFKMHLLYLLLKFFLLATCAERRAANIGRRTRDPLYKK